MNNKVQIPIVFAVTAASALALMRTGLLPRPLGIAGLIASAVFLLGAVLSIFGTAAGEFLALRTPAVPPPDRTVSGQERKAGG